MTESFLLSKSFASLPIRNSEKSLKVDPKQNKSKFLTKVEEKKLEVDVDDVRIEPAEPTGN